MKKTVALLLVALTLFSLSACTSESLKDAQDNAVYREDVVDFNLYVPDSWIVDSTSFVVSAHAGKDDNSTVMMTQTDLPGGVQTITDIFDETMKNISSIYERPDSDYKIEEAKVAGEDAEIRTYTIIDRASKTTLKYMQCLFIKDFVLYTFTYYSTADLFDTHLEEAKKILDSVSFGKSTPPAGMKAAVSAGTRFVDSSDFSIQIPQDWLVDTSTGFFTAMAPGGDHSNLSVMRSTVTETSASAYYKANEASLKQMSEDFTVVAHDEDIIIKDTENNSYSAVCVEYTATISKQAYHFKQLFCLKGTTMYIVTFSSPKALYQTHKDAFNKSILSFTLVTK